MYIKMEWLKKLACSYLKTVDVWIVLGLFGYQYTHYTAFMHRLLRHAIQKQSKLARCHFRWKKTIQHYWFQCGYCGIVCRITALSRKICWHFFPFCSPLWELEDKIASITATTASFRLSEQSLYLQHHASLTLSHGLVENFDGSFVFIWGPRAKGTM